MAIAGALQVNTMLEEIDLAETDQVMYYVPSTVVILKAEWTTNWGSRGYKGWAPDKLTGCESDFAHLVWPSEGKFFSLRSLVQIVLPTCENQLLPCLKHFIWELSESRPLVDY